MPRARTLVLATHERQFIAYCRSAGLPGAQAKFISSEHQLMGARGEALHVLPWLGSHESSSHQRWRTVQVVAAQLGLSIVYKSG